MTERKGQATAEELKKVVIEAILDKKGSNITVMDLRELGGAVTDFFIICEGNSTPQIDAIKDSVEKMVREQLGEKPWHIEGEEVAEWVLMDYVSIVVHIFQKHIREYYDIESLWGDAKIVQIK